MSSLKPVLQSNNVLFPTDLDRWFPLEQQRNYTSILMGRGGLTRRRAEYFIRLWAYLLLKHQQETRTLQTKPLTKLYLLDDFVACTHREASELFYGSQERGSDRAAGMMIDRLMALGLLEKQFDGQTLCIKVRSLPELMVDPSQIEAPISLQPDVFNPRTDAIPVANLIARTYAELIQSNRSLKDPLAASHKIARVLRNWAKQYPAGIRVLRRQDNQNPVAISILYPTASESEANFFQPISRSFYLTADTEVDPFQMAAPGDPNCTSIYIRAWTIDMAHLSRESLCLLLEDTQQTLSQMREEFPNLCDMYSAFAQPMYEELRLALGFQKICQDSQRSYSWIYLALDHFLNQDAKQVVASLKLSSNTTT